MEQNLVVIENITGLGKDSITEMYFAQIRYLDPVHPIAKDQRPKWTECIREDSLITDQLYLYPGTATDCVNGTLASQTSSRYYLLGYDLYNAVLVLKSGEKTMYVSMPDMGIQTVNSLYAESVYRELNRLNCRPDKNPFYIPHLYISSIEFKEGVYLLSDFSGDLNVKRFAKEDILEFYEISDPLRESPKEYWNDEIGFFAPYEYVGISYRYALPGAISEKEAIRQVVEHSPQFIRELLIYAHWQKYIAHRATKEGDLAVQEIWTTSKMLRRQTFEQLSESFKNGKTPQKELLLQWNAFAKTHLQTILEEDFSLAVEFIHYLQKDKEEINDFSLLFDRDTNAVEKSSLKEFIIAERNKEK